MSRVFSSNGRAPILRDDFITLAAQQVFVLHENNIILLNLFSIRLSDRVYLAFMPVLERPSFSEKEN